MSILYMCAYKIQNMDIYVAIYNICMLCVYTYMNKHTLAHLSSECNQHTHVCIQYTICVYCICVYTKYNICILCGNTCLLCWVETYIHSVEIYVYCICVHTKYKSYVCCVERYLYCVEIHVNCVEIWAYCICVYTQYRICIIAWQCTTYVYCVCIHTRINTYLHTSAASVTNTHSCVYNIQYVYIVYVCIQNKNYM